MRNMPLVAATRPWCGSNPNCKWGPYLKRELCLQVVNMALFTHSLCTGSIAWLQSKISSCKSITDRVRWEPRLSGLGSGRVAGFVYRSSGRLAHLIKAHSICTGRGLFFLFCFFFLLPTTFHANDKYVAYVFDWLLQAAFSGRSPRALWLWLSNLFK